VGRSDDKWLTADEAASYLKVSRSTVYRWVKEGRLSLYHLGPATSRFNRKDLDQLAHSPRPRGDEFLDLCSGTAEIIRQDLSRQQLPDSVQLLRSLRRERGEGL